jgi:DNA replication and repair protein RecF
MQLKSLQLVNFKNYAEAYLEFSPKINVLVGSNGSGKTNLLDAIHYLSLTRSAFTMSDNFSVRHGEKFFSIKGVFSSGGSSAEVFCAVQPGSKKIVREGVNEYQKLSDHVGKYPVVLIAPDDTGLVKEGSEERRRFFDSMIAQLDRGYLEALIEYNHILRQRNSLLKMFAETNSFDAVALESYDHAMAQRGNLLFQKREEFIASFIPVFRNYYNFIVADEKADLFYQSELKNVGFQEGLLQNRQRDLYLQRSNFGIHRDDYVFNLGDHDLKKLGSQGQQKSFIIGLKLAQFELIKVRKGIKPILLLDDIFDKLDDNRIGKLLQMIKNDAFGQLFITDARPDRTSGLLQEIHVPANVYNVNGGVIEKDGKEGIKG